MRRLPFDLLSLSPDRLISEAVSRTALDDFGSHDYEAALDVLTTSAECDARLTTVGRLALRQHILGALTTRLLEEDVRKRRVVDDIEREIQPVVVVGLPRSGTTLLHRLLTLKPKARGLAYWEVRTPINPPGRDRRIEQAKRQLMLLDQLAPRFKAMHQVRAEDPEECWFLLDGSLSSCTFWMTAPVYGYLDWYLDQDPSDGYARYRAHLMRFCADRPDEQLVLKSPIHTLNLGFLRQVLPEATIIQMHRDPVACVGSVNSVARELQGAVTDHIDPARLGRTNLDLLARAANAGVAQRGRWEIDPVIDVYYDDLVADPMRTLRLIFLQAGGEFTAEHEARVRAYLLNDPAPKPGAHRYRSDVFHLRDDDIRRVFEGYYDRFPRLRHDESHSARG